METTAITIEDSAALAGLGIYWMVSMVLAVILIIAMWKIYTKAGQPGWAAIVPIYNIYILLKVVGRPGWWLLLLLIPIVNFVVLIIVQIDLANAFGKGMGFALGLIFLPWIFQLILGFGDAQYRLQPQVA